MCCLRGVTLLGQAQCSKCPLPRQSGWHSTAGPFGTVVPKLGDVVATRKGDAQGTLANFSCILVRFFTQSFATGYCQVLLSLNTLASLWCHRLGCPSVFPWQSPWNFLLEVVVTQSSVTLVSPPLCHSNQWTAGPGVLQHCRVGLALSMPRCFPGGAAVGTGLGAWVCYSTLFEQSFLQLCLVLGLPMGINNHWEIIHVGVAARGWGHAGFC